MALPARSGTDLPRPALRRDEGTRASDRWDNQIRSPPLEAIQRARWGVFPTATDKPGTNRSPDRPPACFPFAESSSGEVGVADYPSRRKAITAAPGHTRSVSTLKHVASRVPLHDEPRSGRCETWIVPELRTERLLLRRWRAGDRAQFAALNVDPEVMRYFPAARTPPHRLAELADAELAHQGWGLWALEERVSGRFIGFTGLASPTFEAPFTPAVEIGWRLSRAAWGFGFATEAARAAADFAFEELSLAELVSYTAEQNVRSRAVMEQLSNVVDRRLRWIRRRPSRRSSWSRRL